MNNISENNRTYNNLPPAYKTFSDKRFEHAYYWQNAASPQKSKKSHSDKKGKNKFNLGYKSVLIIAACLLFTKGFQKNISRGLEALKNKLEYKQEANSFKEKTKMFKFFENCSRALSSLIKKSESINNITSLKDILFMKLMYKTKLTKNIHKGISNYFDSVSRKTVRASYLKTQKALDAMESRFQILDEHLLKTCGDEIITYKDKEITVRQLIELAKEKRKDIYLVVGNFISPKSQDRRHGYIKTATSNLYKTFWEASFKDFTLGNNKFTRREMWQTFIAAEQVKSYKTKLANAVSQARKFLSCDNKDSNSEILQVLSDLKQIIPKSDTEGYEQVKKLEWLAKNGDILKTHKEIFLKELKNLALTQTKNINSDITKQLKDSKNSYIKLITNLVNDNEPGEIQKLIDMYYKIKPFEFAESGALQAAKEAVKSFNKSAHLENSEYFDKVRDLELGSAPTDVLTILLSAGLISHDLLKAKDNNQKTSVMLTSGIPLVGAIATTVISTTKLVSGGKSLALGFVSGILLNFIGKFVDKYRLKYFNKNAIQNNQTTPVNKNNKEEVYTYNLTKNEP